MNFVFLPGEGGGDQNPQSYFGVGIQYLTGSGLHTVGLFLFLEGFLT